jgi:hypothetical protein
MILTVLKNEVIILGGPVMPIYPSAHHIDYMNNFESSPCMLWWSTYGDFCASRGGRRVATTLFRGSVSAGE